MVLNSESDMNTFLFSSVLRVTVLRASSEAGTPRTEEIIDLKYF